MKVKIGLETHVQLSTKSKLFCGCRNPVRLKEEPEPNTFTCVTCLGMPGSKPRVNAEVINMALRVSLALNCKIAREMFFSRKTYFYPDMAKNFQITQYEIPVARDGFVEINTETGRKKIKIKRVHIEEDPARIVHVGGIGGKYTLVDYNRSGIPLLEIVTEPDLSSPEEARTFINKLTAILEYLDVYDSSSRAVIKSDANISVEGGERIEVKNITGSKEIEQALNYEILRQKNILSKGGKITGQTRMWDPERGVTQGLRTKEKEEDYGYIFEPDLTRITIPEETKIKIKETLPELPDEKYQKFVSRFGLSEKLAESLASERDIAELFEYTAEKISPKVAASWIAGYLKKTLNWYGLSFRNSRVKREWIVSLLEFFEKGKITDRNAELVIRKMIEEKRDPKTIIEEYDLWKAEINLKEVVARVMEKNPKAVEDYKAGEEKALHFLVGMVMKETRGRVDAKEVRETLLTMLRKFGE